MITMLRASLVGALALSFVLVACSDEVKDTKNPSQKDSIGGDVAADSSSTPTQSEPAAVRVAHKFEVKSGIVEMKSSFMDEWHQTMYFDDFGEKLAIVTVMNILGTKNVTVQIHRDGYEIDYNVVQKTGTKITSPTKAGFTSSGGIPNLEMLTDEEKRVGKYQEIESRTVAGKEAKGISMESLGGKVKLWTWKGVPLLFEMSGPEKKALIIEATTIQTDVEIPAVRFVVPVDVKISDVSGSVGMGSAKPDTSK